MRNRVNCVKYYETEGVLRKPGNTQQHVDVDEGIKKEFCENYLFICMPMNINFFCNISIFSFLIQLLSHNSRKIKYRSSKITRKNVSSSNQE